MDLPLLLIERLPHEPQSLFRAHVLGDDSWMGWGRAESLLASLIDGQGYQTQATAVNRKARYRDLAPRPAQKKQERVISTRDDVGAALGGLLG